MNAVRVVLILSPSGGRPVQALPSTVSLRSILISSSHLRPGIPSGLFRFTHLPKPSVYLSSLPHVPHAFPLLIICYFIIIVRVGELNSLIDTQFKLLDA